MPDLSTLGNQRSARILLGLMLMLSSPSHSAGAQGTPATRYWQSGRSGAVFDIAPCADTLESGALRPSLCGRLVWSKEGATGPDKNNSDERLRSRSLCRILVLGGLSVGGTNSWSDGWVYDVQKGRRFTVKSFEFTSDSTATLHVRVAFLRVTDQWRRVDAPPARCDA